MLNRIQGIFSGQADGTGGVGQVKALTNMCRVVFKAGKIHLARLVKRRTTSNGRVPVGAKVANWSGAIAGRRAPACGGIIYLRVYTPGDVVRQLASSDSKGKSGRQELHSLITN